MNKFLVVCLLPAVALAAPSRNGFRVDFGAGLPGAGEISGKISGNSDAGTYSTKASGNRALNGYNDDSDIDIEGSYGRDGTPHVPLNTPFNVPTQFNSDEAAEITKKVVKNVLNAIPNNDALLNEEQLNAVADYITTSLRQAMVADPNQFNPDQLADTVVGIVNNVAAALPNLAPNGIPGVIGEIPRLINEDQVRAAVEKTIKSLGPALEYARDPLNANRPVDVEFKFGDSENFVELKPAASPLIVDPVAPVAPVAPYVATAPRVYSVAAPATSFTYGAFAPRFAFNAYNGYPYAARYF